MTLLEFANLSICLASLAIVICRGTAMSPRTTRVRVRLLYVLIGVSAVGSGAARWVVGDPVSVWQVIAGAALLGQLLVYSDNWVLGQPLHATKSFKPFTDEETK